MKNYLFFLILILSCSLPEDKFLVDFGIFINETEANFENYDDTEWELTELNFIKFKEEFKELEYLMDESETKQVKSYIKRFEKVQIRRDPLNNLIEIFR
jgi:hypothetical protein